jgi:undecaprenyl-diphosphatase
MARMTEVSPKSLEKPAGGAKSYLGRLVVLLAAISVARVLYVALSGLALSGDEAQYWDWSRRLEWCYFSKGPMVAWLIWLGRAALGDTALGVRLPAIILSAGTSLMLYDLGRRLYDARTGFAAALLMQITPIFAAFGVGMSIDPPYLFFWVAALLLLYRAVADHSRFCWLLLGLALGLGLLSKYTIGLFYPCAFGWLLFGRQRRGWLKTPWPYLAVAISLAFLLPLLQWNAQNGWVNFQHNIGHAHHQKEWQLTPLKTLVYVGSQLGVVTPVLLVMMLVAQWQLRGRDSFSPWFCLPVLGFFLLISLQTDVYANWPLTAYVTGCIVFAARFLGDRTGQSTHLRRTVNFAVILALVCTLAVMVVVVVPLPFLPSKPPHVNVAGRDFTISFLCEKKDPSHLFAGWDQLGKRVADLEGELGPRRFVIGSERMTTSRLAYYIPGQPQVYHYRSPKGEIDSQYHVWKGYEDLLGYDALFVTYRNGDNPVVLPKDVQASFASAEETEFVSRDLLGRPITTYHIWLCRDYRGPAATAAAQAGGGDSAGSGPPSP